MPITIGTETAGHFQIGTERVGLMKIGTEIAYRLAPPDTGQTTPWAFATSFTTGYAIDFLPANPLSANRLFEVTPPRGTLEPASPRPPCSPILASTGLSESTGLASDSMILYSTRAAA